MFYEDMIWLRAKLLMRWNRLLLKGIHYAVSLSAGTERKIHGRLAWNQHCYARCTANAPSPFRSRHQEAKWGEYISLMLLLSSKPQHHYSYGVPFFLSIGMRIRAFGLCSFAFSPPYFTLARRHGLRYKALVSCAVCAWVLYYRLHTSRLPLTPFFKFFTLFSFSLA